MTAPAEHAATVREALDDLDVPPGWTPVDIWAEDRAEEKAKALVALDALEAQADDRAGFCRAADADARDAEKRAEAAEAERDRLHEEAMVIVDERDRLAARVSELEAALGVAERLASEAMSGSLTAGAERADVANTIGTSVPAPAVSDFAILADPRGWRPDTIRSAAERLRARIAELEAALRTIAEKERWVQAGPLTDIARAALATDKEQA